MAYGMKDEREQNLLTRQKTYQKGGENNVKSSLM